MSTIPTFQEMWSRYLFNQASSVKGDDLLNESLIRENILRQDEDTGNYIQTDKEGSKIQITASDFMGKDGAGRFVKGANFNAVTNFFTFKHVPININGKEWDKYGELTKQYNLDSFDLRNIAKNSGDLVKYDEETGAYHFTLEQMFYINEYSQTTLKNADGKRIDKDGNILTDEEIDKFQYLGKLDKLPVDLTVIEDGSENEDGTPKGTTVNLDKSILQRQFHPDGELDKDFAERVQLFESTNFQIGNGVAPVKFVLYPDGHREIKNFALTPSGDDNFDFVGGNGDAGEKLGNAISEFVSDPSV